MVPYTSTRLIVGFMDASSGSPIRRSLVEIRAYLEKIRPIDKQLSYQIDKLLKAAQVASAAPANGRADTAGRAQDEQDEQVAWPGPSSTAAAAAGRAGREADALQYGPRPDAVVPKIRTAGGTGAGDDNTAGTAARVSLTSIYPSGFASRLAAVRGGLSRSGVRGAGMVDQTMVRSLSRSWGCVSLRAR